MKGPIPRLSTSVGKPFPLAWMHTAQLHTLGMGSQAATVPNYRDGIPWDLDMPVRNRARVGWPETQGLHTQPTHPSYIP